jgi:hypothetical protein
MGERKSFVWKYSTSCLRGDHFLSIFGFSEHPGETAATIDLSQLNISASLWIGKTKGFMILDIFILRVSL